MSFCAFEIPNKVEISSELYHKLWLILYKNYLIAELLRLISSIGIS